MHRLGPVFALGFALSIHAGEDENGTDEAEPSLERLLELNSEAIFGGKVTIDGDLFEVVFDKDGQMKLGFVGKGIIDSKSKEMVGAQRKFIIKEKKKDEEETLIDGFAALGLKRGQWVSRFPVAGEVWVDVDFRVPNLLTQTSDFRLRINWKKNSGYETSFFTNIAYLSGGRVRSRKMTAGKEYQRAASYWFPRKKDAVNVQFGMSDGACVVLMDDKEMVSVPDAPDRGGNVAFAYNKILFTICNLKISGKLDRKWCKKEISRLKKKGQLKTQEEKEEKGEGEESPEAG